MQPKVALSRVFICWLRPRKAYPVADHVQENFMLLGDRTRDFAHWTFGRIIRSAEKEAAFARFSGFGKRGRVGLPHGGTNRKRAEYD